LFQNVAQHFGCWQGASSDVGWKPMSEFIATAYERNAASGQKASDG